MQDYRLLREIPLFSALNQGELSLVNQRCSVAEYKKGQDIYCEGSPPDCFYCLLLGRVVIFSKDSSGNEKVLEYLHRGKYFGIISLLTGEAHSVTARALNDCALLVIRKEDFDFLLKKIPALAIDLSQTLSRRLKNKDLHQKTIFESTIISVYSSYGHAGKTVYALNLALGLKREVHKPVVILDLCPAGKEHSLPARLGLKAEDVRIIELSGNSLSLDYLRKTAFGIDLLCFHYDAQQEPCVKALLDIISRLVNDYNYLILDLPSEMDRSILAILNQSDTIHILSSPEPVDLKRTRNLILRLKEEFAFHENKINIIINEYKHSRLTYKEQVALLGHCVFATLPRIELEDTDRLLLESPDCEYSKAVRRICRQLGEVFVGLALGVGFAYGLCHIGVLKAIEEERIPIDVIVGSSIGAIIAALWACGKSSNEIIEIISEFKEQRHLWDYADLTWPLLGFLKGKKLERLLDKHLGKKTFYDVKLPLKIVASDVRKKEPRVFAEGSLAEAVRASCSMPGLFKPFRLKQDMLFDGGVIYPLPTEVLFKMGVKRIIAVNVTPSREDIARQRAEFKQNISNGIGKKICWFNPRSYFRAKFSTNILDIIFTSIEAMQTQMVEREAQLADIVLHPDTQGLHWLEIHRVRDFVKRGEEETRRNLDRIRQLVNE